MSGYVDENNTHATTVVAGVGLYDEQTKAIYENLKPEESSDFILSHIPNAEVEAYLNKVIGSKKVGDDFRVRIIL
ncbi:hypothetical protein E2C01_048512 [Portunus trituberculatus]|uniref:Uncharacterized protein n=1 Tax=Portunus trituberculatus TaxID=210409 RepID=A0A5B7GAF0_PORTR|nr:hypothetical protein [Portunus trituberculatus]